MQVWREIHIFAARNSNKTIIMRRIFLVFFLAALSVYSTAQNTEVKKIIRKYDVSYLRSALTRGFPADYWNCIMDNDKRVMQFNEAVDKNDKTLGEACYALECAEKNIPRDNTVSGNESVLSKLVEDLGIRNLVNKYPIKVIMDDDINASMDYTGQMRINSGCFDKLSYKELLAACAHELAHYTCAHVLSRVWKTAKKQKRNRMWADIGTSLAVGVMAATSVNDIIANADILYYSAYNYADDATIKYRYRYSREEETEADIIAYRFMEQMGYGGENVLSLLQKLRSLYGDEPAGKYDDHPSTTFRILVISALINGYEGKGTAKINRPFSDDVYK